jgi:hypothetical protein
MVMASETTPVLSGPIPAFVMFMSTWEDLAERHPRLSQWIDIGMDKTKEYYRWMDHTTAYVMSMCESVDSWIIILLTVISFESLNLYELDPEALVARVHQRRRTEDQSNSKLCQ